MQLTGSSILSQIANSPVSLKGSDFWPSLQEKAEKRLLRLRLENSLLEFTRHFFRIATGNEFIVADLHKTIDSNLMRVVAGEVKNLLINMPPRYGKTEMVVIMFIAWCIAKNPKAKFIHLSYSDDLALDNSGRIKELVESDEFQELWPVKLKQDSKSKKKWYTEQGGGVYATAAGGPITGFGAGQTIEEDGLFGGAIIIDDPHKVDDVGSDVEREKVNRRLNTTIKSRRNSRNTPIIVNMQRLHEEDMSGFILGSGIGEPFEHAKLKALQDDGTALWPHKHTVEELLQMKAIDPETFSGQYQQEPSPPDGIYFKREWMRWYEEKPKHLRIYGASDYAVTDEGGDYTVHLVAGVDPEDNIYLLDLWRGQKDSLVWVEVFIQMVLDYRPAEWAEEAGQIARSMGPLLDKRQRETKAYCFRKQFSSATDKQTRAQAIRGRMAQGKVYFPKNAVWMADFVHELMMFDNGKHDDQVDAFGLLGRLLSEMVAGRVPPEPQKTRWPLEMTFNELRDQQARRRRELDD